MALPPRRKRDRANIRNDGPIRCDGHLRWVRGFCCVLNSIECEGRIEAAHVRNGTDGGTGQKPGDNWVVPICAKHHALQHRQGEISFWSAAKIDPLKLASEFWEKSPHRAKLDR
jgi:hypothetical protein